MLFDKLLQDDLGTGRWSVLHRCGCSSVGRARPRHGRGHEFETRHSLQDCACKRSPFARRKSVRRDGHASGQTHFGCVHALRGHMTWCWWSGMCAVLGQTTCSETPHPTGCSRLGTAEVEVQEAPVELTVQGWKSAATIGRRRNPSPDGSRGGVAQRSLEQLPCRRRAAGSNPVTSTNATTLRQLGGQSAGLSSRKPRIRLPHEAPHHLPR